LCKSVSLQCELGKTFVSTRTFSSGFSSDFFRAAVMLKPELLFLVPIGAVVLISGVAASVTSSAVFLASSLGAGSAMTCAAGWPSFVFSSPVSLAGGKIRNFFF